MTEEVLLLEEEQEAQMSQNSWGAGETIGADGVPGLV